MANLIELAKSYVPMLDEVYKLASCTSDLDGAPELARQGANANELIIPMLEMDGLADYDRNGGYVAGDVKMENRTVQCNFDRGRMFTVDTMDNAERRSCRSWTPSASPAMLASPASVPRRPRSPAART